jgi:tetratricopeptide (TPR) repeat protein
LQNRGIIELDLGRLDEAVRTMSESCRLRRRLDDESGVARSMANLALVHYAAARHGLALQLLRESSIQREKLGDRQGAATVHTNLGTILVDLGDLDRAARHYAIALDLARTIESPTALAAAQLETASLHLRRGDWNEALRLAAVARRSFGGLGRPDDVARADLVLVQAEIETGSVPAARRRLAGAMRVLRRSGRVLPVITAHSLAGSIRDGVCGLASLAAAGRLADRCGLREQSWKVRRIRGRKLLAMGRRREGAETLREAMEILRGIHGDLPAPLRQLYLDDPLKTDVRALFTEATQQVLVGEPS